MYGQNRTQGYVLPDYLQQAAMARSRFDLPLMKFSSLNCRANQVDPSIIATIDRFLLSTFCNFLQVDKDILHTSSAMAYKWVWRKTLSAADAEGPYW